MAAGLHAIGALGKECVGREAGTLIRLHVVVEGQTEEAFINEVLAPELGGRGILTDAHRITTGRKHGRPFRGGWHSYTQLIADLIRWMRQDPHRDSHFSTMIDLYRLPQDFPGYPSCHRIQDPMQRVESLEQHLTLDVRRRFGDDPLVRRFIPYIQLHEFEALLFAEPSKFLVAFPEQDGVVERVQAIRNQCGGPEAVNDGETTAPSKRIVQLLPDYVKAVSGILIVKQIGIPKLRQECPHFDQWLARLLQLLPHGM